jgi:sugar phosphate permease
VAGIIDGSGSLGAAVGQIIIGVSVTKWGWQKFMLIIAIDITLTVIPLIKIVIEECIDIYRIVTS